MNEITSSDLDRVRASLRETRNAEFERFSIMGLRLDEEAVVAAEYGAVVSVDYDRPDVDGLHLTLTPNEIAGRVRKATGVWVIVLLRHANERSSKVA